MAEWKGPRAGLLLLETMRPPGWLCGYYLWSATWGELSRRAADFEAAERHLERAIELAPTNAERSLFQARLQRARSCDSAR